MQTYSLRTWVKYSRTWITRKGVWGGGDGTNFQVVEILFSSSTVSCAIKHQGQYEWREWNHIRSSASKQTLIRWGESGFYSPWRLLGHPDLADVKTRASGRMWSQKLQQKRKKELRNKKDLFDQGFPTTSSLCTSRYVHLSYKSVWHTTMVQSKPLKWGLEKWKLNRDRCGNACLLPTFPT